MDKQANKWINRQTVKNTLDKKYPDTHTNRQRNKHKNKKTY